MFTLHTQRENVKVKYIKNDGFNGDTLKSAIVVVVSFFFSFNLKMIINLKCLPLDTVD